MTTKRKERPIRNPLHLLAGKQPIGPDSERMLFPYQLHLQEVALGHGYGTSVRLVTYLLSASYDASLFYRLPQLEKLANEAGDAWIQAGERCQAKGITERVICTGDELETIRKCLRALVHMMPTFELGAWTSFIENAARRWAKFAGGETSAFRHYA